MKRDQKILVASSSESLFLEMRKQTLFAATHWCPVVSGDGSGVFAAFAIIRAIIVIFLCFWNVWNGMPSGGFVHGQEVIVRVNDCRGK
jgi:hypothetical protein